MSLQSLIFSIAILSLEDALLMLYINKKFIFTGISLMKRAFRKYHRVIAIIVSLPVAITVLTGIIVTMVGEWGVNIGLTRHVLLSIHTGEIFHLEGIYPILNGLGLIGLLVTGLSMSGLFGKATRPQIK